ncbi:MAG: site-specific integrase [Methylovirgula sp.]
MLCASRTAEVVEARWGEIDRAAKLWTIPAERMKAGREHRVPLGARALAIVDTAEKIRVGEYVFPGQLRGKPLSNMAMAMLIRRLGAEAFTVHGFRSSFRDWAGEATSFPREVAEAALAHTIGDKAEQAYRRADALAKRRKLMDAWGGYLGTSDVGSKVLWMKRQKEGR